MKYRVTVNGKKYEVEVERADAPKTSASASPARDQAAAAASPSAPADGGGEFVVRAPMPGSIVEIRVAPGQPVKKGQVLVILEAMKMENEIPADRDGVVGAVPVSKGDAVNTGDALLTLG